MQPLVSGEARYAALGPEEAEAAFRAHLEELVAAERREASERQQVSRRRVQEYVGDESSPLGKHVNTWLRRLIKQLFATGSGFCLTVDVGL